MEIQARPRASTGLRCAVCHSSEAGWLTCRRCRTLVHGACLAWLARCPTLGCSPQPRPRPIPRPETVNTRTGTPSGCLVAASLLLLWLVGGCVAVSFVCVEDRPRASRVKCDFKVLGWAIDLFKIDNGFYPNQLSELWERPAGADGWGPEPYLREWPPTDPWGNEYAYERRSGSDYVVISYGADGVPGGEAECADLDSSTMFQQSP